MDEDFVEDEIFGVDEVFCEKCFESGVHACDELGVGGVLFGECGFVFT